MTSIEPIIFKATRLCLQFLKPFSSTRHPGPRTKGKTNIGCIFQASRTARKKTYYLYNVCDHQECYQEVGSQAISYTTGVPAMIGAMLVMNGTWNKPASATWKSSIPIPSWTC